MPGIKDIVLASLIEKDLPENPEIYSHTTPGKLDNSQSLTTPELSEQYDNEFRSYFSEVWVDSRIISSSTFFSVKCEKNLIRKACKFFESIIIVKTLAS